MPASDSQTHKDQLLEETLKSSVRLCFKHWEVISNNNCPSCKHLELAKIWRIIAPPSESASTVFCAAIFIWFYLIVWESGLRDVEEEKSRAKPR